MADAKKLKALFDPPPRKIPKGWVEERVHLMRRMGGAPFRPKGIRKGEHFIWKVREKYGVLPSLVGKYNLANADNGKTSAWSFDTEREAVEFIQSNEHLDIPLWT